MRTFKTPVVSLLALLASFVLPGAIRATEVQEPVVVTTSTAPSAEKIPIAVLPLGLSDQTAERYPQLTERNVGLGIHNMIVNELYETGLFRFVEDKKTVVDDVLERQWVSASGGVSPESAVAYGKLLGARYVLYGEVYDFATRRLRRKVGETHIAIQIRLIDVETAEFVPGSGEGTITSKGQVFPREDVASVARSTVGQASQEALRAAVTQLMKRL